MQLDPANTGTISAGDAAQFLKKSGLSDSTLGKVGLELTDMLTLNVSSKSYIIIFFYYYFHFFQIWDLADSDRKGYLDKRVTQSFFP